MENDKKLFVKLKITSLLDLALIVPNSYDDTSLSQSITAGKTGTFEAIVEDIGNLNGKLRISFLLPKFHNRISSIFFRATPYHYQIFSKGSTHYIQGRVEEYNGYLQMTQPKSIKKINHIIPKYKSAIKHCNLVELISKYITEQNLYNEGLNNEEVATLLSIHFPKDINQIQENNKFKNNIIEKLKFIEAYNHIKKLQSKRIDYPALCSLDGEVDSFVDNLPFVLTREQEKVIGEIRLDLNHSNKACKRMVVGDVGSGKTMVILASVMMAYPQKSILMAPTSLLALQLYEEACKYLPKHIKTALVSQRGSQGDYTEANFVIGTHAILYKDDLPSVPLVMIDEQHRFGSKQRQMLESMMSMSDKRPHFIQFSATPIPRTQAMMQSALLDVSLILSTPFDREVTSKIIGKSDFTNLMSHIKDEITKKHQILIIYPLVEQSSEVPYQSLDESRDYWEKRFDNVFVTHGGDKEKENKLIEFRESGDILLATTVVEVGISLPRLTTIVIVGAERLGLATLHQLRGRVGRNGLDSSCYLFTNDIESTNKPLSRLNQFCNTTNGFDIAKLDLRFRDSGDILDGTIQSGQKFKWLNMGEDEEIVAKAKSRIS